MMIVEIVKLEVRARRRKKRQRKTKSTIRRKGD